MGLIFQALAIATAALTLVGVNLVASSVVVSQSPMLHLETHHHLDFKASLKWGKVNVSPIAEPHSKRDDRQRRKWSKWQGAEGSRVEKGFEGEVSFGEG